MKYLKIICVLTVLIPPNVHSLECEVDYIAKRTEKEKRWFGTVKETEVKSGTERGRGNTKGECRDNALSKVTIDGWRISSERTKLK